MLHFISWSAYNRMIIVLMILWYPTILGMYYRNDILIRIRKLIGKT
ncbi:MAG TPA: hypothetical protein VNS58_01050 [Puia sp.]|nr:hypothetical protein [Puia sp.]